MKKLRVGIVGSAGTGKSGLGRDIAAKLEIPFLPAKDITRPILNQRKYDWAGGVYVEKFLALEECQDEILKRTVEVQKKHESFVTDRTSIDLAAYAIAELHHHPDKVNAVVAACRSHAKTYTHLIFCPWGLVPLESNQVRTVNPWYQFCVHSLMLGVLREWGLPFKVIETTGDSRLPAVFEYIS